MAQSSVHTKKKQVIVGASAIFSLALVQHKRPGVQTQALPRQAATSMEYVHNLTRTCKNLCEVYNISSHIQRDHTLQFTRMMLLFPSDYLLFMLISVSSCQQYLIEGRSRTCPQ